MPTVLACLWRRVAATQLGRVPTHFGPATRLRRPESPWNQGALATSQVEMCPRTANSGQVTTDPNDVFYDYGDARVLAFLERASDDLRGILNQAQRYAS